MEFSEKTDALPLSRDRLGSSPERSCFDRLTVARELRVIELKKEVNVLCVEAGEPPRYARDLGPEEAARLPLPTAALPSADQLSIAQSLMEDAGGSRELSEKLACHLVDGHEGADRQRHYFLAMLGHELRNPLAAIRHGMQLLRSDKARAETRTVALPIVADQVDHLERLVDDLLDASRVVQGIVQVRREPMPIQDALDRAIEMVRPQTDAGGFLIELRVPAAPLQVLGDCVRLTQAFTNVLANAIKFSGDSRLIEVGAEREENEVVVRIRDHGLGINPERLPQIFKTFVQPKTGSRLQIGLGLGLAVARQLVRLHDGEIHVFSTGDSRGSEFALHFPSYA